jgi:AraC family transcriptional regulator
MSLRIMMRSGGRTRPLTLNPSRPEPLLISAATPWAGLPFEEHRIGDSDRAGFVGPIDGEYGALAILDGQFDIVARQGGREVRHTSRAGTLSLLSGDHRREVLSIRGNATALAINIPVDWFGQLALDRAPAGFGRSPPLVADATVGALVRAMRDEVARGATTGRIYAESLSLALLSYVVEQLPGSRFHVRGRLSEAQRRRLQRYIRERLNDELSLSELAGVVSLSPRYFSKLFRDAFGVTPHRYVLQQRLAEGARLIARGGQDLVDIALRVGFCSQSHFTAAFRRAYGVTPYRYAAAKR